VLTADEDFVKCSNRELSSLHVQLRNSLVQFKLHGKVLELVIQQHNLMAGCEILTLVCSFTLRDK